MNKLQKYWKDLFHIGVNYDLEFNERVRIRLLNHLNLLTIVAVITYGTYFFTVEYYQLFIVCLGTLVCYLLSLYLNHIGKYRFNRFFWYITLHISLFIGATYLGREVFMQALFYPTLFLPFIFFKKTDKVAIYALLTVTIATFFLLEITDYSLISGEYISPENTRSLYFTHIILTVFLSFLLGSSYSTLYSEQLASNKEMLRSSLEVEKAINYFSTSLFGKNTEEEILWDLAKNCISKLDFEDAVVYIMDEEQQQLIQVAAYGPKNPKSFDIANPITLKIGQGIVGRAAERKEAILVRDTQKDPNYVVDDEERHSELAVPMIYNGQVLGVIDSEHHQKNYFSYRHLQILRTVASLAANKIVSVRGATAKEEAEKIRALDQLKSRFFTNISHEFRTPLTLIMGPIKDRMARETRPEDKRINEVIYSNAQRLLRLINQLLDLAKLDAGQLQLDVKQDEVFRFLRVISKNFLHLTLQKQITFNIEIPDSGMVLAFDPDILEKAVYNLLSNSFKYTPEKGTITLTAVYTNQQLQVTVQDTGIGIPPTMHDKIFDRFFMSETGYKASNQSTGIGLALSKELVELHGGKLELLESKPGKGSVFSISIPLKRIEGATSIDRNIHSIQPDTKPILAPSAPVEAEPLLADQDSPSILIVEDNTDLQFYIQSILAPSYVVEKANNGKEGLEKAQHKVPDLIICDVNMPVMDGFEFAEKIRSQTITDHIPLIMLTAQADQKSKLKGLKIGVDDYLTKPFDAEELRIRIHNLLQQREKLRQKFSDTVLPKIAAETSSESAKDLYTGSGSSFLYKAVTVLEQNIDNTSFSAEDFAAALDMSRMQLHRKLKAITQLTTSEFTRNYRIRKAGKLLLQTDYSVSQIALEVGFNSLSYFSKSFREVYDCTPSEYQQKHQQQR